MPFEELCSKHCVQTVWIFPILVHCVLKLSITHHPFPLWICPNTQSLLFANELQPVYLFWLCICVTLYVLLFFYLKWLCKLSKYTYHRMETWQLFCQYTNAFINGRTSLWPDCHQNSLCWIELKLIKKLFIFIYI